MSAWRQAGAAALALAACATGVADEAAPPSPLTFRYAAQDDAPCAAARGRPVDEAWVRELQARLPEFNRLWAEAGPAMARAVADLTGKPFEAPRQVRLTLCDTPSNALAGVTVNMRYALASFTAEPVPLRYKIDTVFHESLHGFVARHVPRRSALLATHAREPACVRNHLHLLALQKAVLLRLHDADALARLIRLDGELPSGCYRRAWALVNDGDTAWQAWVAELAE